MCTVIGTILTTECATHEQALRATNYSAKFRAVVNTKHTTHRKTFVEPQQFAVYAAIFKSCIMPNCDAFQWTNITTAECSVLSAND